MDGSVAYTMKNVEKPSVSQSCSFVDVLELYESPLLRYVSQLMGYLSEEAEDIVQESFFRLHKKIKKDGWDSIQNLKPWLYRVCHNLVMDAGRKKTLEKKHKDKLKESNDVQKLNRENDFGELEKMVHEEACRRAMEELQSLEEDEKELLLLKLVQGFTLKEIAEIVDSNIGRVNYQINKALQNLSERLKARGII